jgi:hypothetical protein
MISHPSEPDQRREDGLPPDPSAEAAPPAAQAAGADGVAADATGETPVCKPDEAVLDRAARYLLGPSVYCA